MLLNFHHIFVLFIIITYLQYTVQKQYNHNEEDKTIELPDKSKDSSEDHKVKGKSYYNEFPNKDEDADLSKEPPENEKYEPIEYFAEKVQNSDETEENKQNIQI